MGIINDVGVYVVQSLKPVPIQPVMPARPMAVIAPMYQIVDQDVDSETDSVFSGDALTHGTDTLAWFTGTLETTTVTYPNLLSEDAVIDTDSVRVLLKRSDGRWADITDSVTPGAESVSFDPDALTLDDELADINDDWGGDSTEDNWSGLAGATIHIEYRARRADLEGTVLSAQGAGIAAVIGKAHPDNPLGLAGGIIANLSGRGAYFVPVEDSENEADVATALGLLEPLNVYAPVVISGNELRHQQITNFVNQMSTPEERSFSFAWTHRNFKTREEIIAETTLTESSTLQEIKAAQVADMVAYATSVFDRRTAVIPHNFVMEVDGEDYTVCGSYLAVAYAALKTEIPPQQGLTNYPLGGIVKKLNMSNNYFKPSHLKELSQHGVFVCLQTTESAPIRSRFQVTTNMTSNTTKQISIVYAADAFSLGFIRTMTPLLGINNITPDLLETIQLSLSAYITATRNSGLILDASIVGLNVNPDDPSQVDAEVDATFPSPLDRIVMLLKY